MIPRRQIINTQCYAHVIFRCHNREYLLRPEPVKNYLLLLWSKYRQRYSIQIIEFIILNNHVHLLVQTPNADCLAFFMRTVNSLLARFINSYFNRDSQAIRERYKSPIITNERYFVQTQQYIWLNRFKADGTRPEYDKYCSAAWRLNPDLYKKFANNPKEELQLGTLLKSLQFVANPPSKPHSQYIQDLINAAISKINLYSKSCFENSYTIGDALDVSFRAELLNAFRRQYFSTAGPLLS